MVPDLPTVERRRHTVTIIVRFLIAAYGAWCLYLFAADCFAPCIAQIVSYPSGAMQAFSIFLGAVVSQLPLLAAMFVFVACEKKLVRWIVPLPARDPGCPKCGYSLKGIKSPICPECGADLNA